MGVMGGSYQTLCTTQTRRRKRDTEREHLGAASQSWVTHAEIERRIDEAVCSCPYPGRASDRPWVSAGISGQSNRLTTSGGSGSMNRCSF